MLQFLREKTVSSKQPQAVVKLLRTWFHWWTKCLNKNLSQKDKMEPLFWSFARRGSFVFKLKKRPSDVSKGCLLLFQAVWSEESKQITKKVELEREYLSCSQLQAVYCIISKILKVSSFKISKLSSLKRLIELWTWVSKPLYQRFCN